MSYYRPNTCELCTGRSFLATSKILPEITSRYEWVLDDQDPETFRIATESNYTALATYLRRLANTVYNLLDDYRGYLDYTETGYDRTFLISTETSAEL